MVIFLPIKQHSQRVPRKNFRDFGGEPLYKVALLKYKQHSVYVDTDSPELTREIKKDKRLSHVTVVPRQDSLKGDLVSVTDIIKDFIMRYNIEDTIAQIHVTSPFLKEETVTKASQYLTEYDSVVACNVYKSRFWRKEKYGYCPVNHNPVKMEQTQDLPTLYEENSAFYIFQPSVVLKFNSRIGISPYFYPISSPENLDIDTEEDWEAALKEIK